MAFLRRGGGKAVRPVCRLLWSGGSRFHSSRRRAGECLFVARVVGKADTLTLMVVALVGVGQRVGAARRARYVRVRRPVVPYPLVAVRNAGQPVGVRDAGGARRQRLPHLRRPADGRRSGGRRVGGCLLRGLSFSRVEQSNGDIFAGGPVRIDTLPVVDEGVVAPSERGIGGLEARWCDVKGEGRGKFALQTQVQTGLIVKHKLDRVFDAPQFEVWRRYRPHAAVKERVAGPVGAIGVASDRDRAGPDRRHLGRCFAYE